MIAFVTDWFRRANVLVQITAMSVSSLLQQGCASWWRLEPQPGVQGDAPVYVSNFGAQLRRRAP